MTYYHRFKQQTISSVAFTQLGHRPCTINQDGRLSAALFRCRAMPSSVCLSFAKLWKLRGTVGRFLEKSVHVWGRVLRRFGIRDKSSRQHRQLTTKKQQSVQGTSVTRKDRLLKTGKTLHLFNLSASHKWYLRCNSSVQINVSRVN